MASTAPDSRSNTYGHLIESLPKRQVEWIDEIVLREGFAAALRLDLPGALSAAAACSLAHRPKTPEPGPDAVFGSFVQSGATGCVAEGGRFELPIPVRV
jgi:hypothetical protein